MKTTDRNIIMITSGGVGARFGASVPKQYVEIDGVEKQPDIEAKARQMQPAEMSKFLNDYSVEQAQRMLARWRQLAFYLVVKYNDMAVKPEENGRFTRSKYGLGATVKRPGYPQRFARELIRQTGSRYELE